MNAVYYEKLNEPKLMTVANTLPTKGVLALSLSGLWYVDISDQYIHDLFPLLYAHHPDITKPDYFSVNGIGAHISVIYPEEKVRLDDAYIGAPIQFKSTGAYRTLIGNKYYYILLVYSFELIELRHSLGLPRLLAFKGFDIDFHITIANKKNK